MTLRYALAKLPIELDPHISSAPELGLFLNNVYETLVYLNRDGRFEPSLAESWQVSPDGLTYTFRLHRGASFHDGTRFNAQAAKENLDRTLDPATRPGKAASLLPGFQAAEVIDLYTISVRLNNPNPVFLHALSQVYLGMVSPASFKTRGQAEYPKTLAGTGPFKFSAEHYVPGSTIVLEKNPEYHWGPASYRQTGPLYFGSGHDPDSRCQKTHLVYDHSGPAYLDRVIIRSIPDPAARVASLATGEVDVAGALSTTDATGLQEKAQFWIIADGNAMHGANRKVNCLTFDVHGPFPFFYDVSWR